MLAGEIQGCFKDRGNCCFTIQVAGPLWTATSRTRPCQDHNWDPSLPRSLEWFSAGLHTVSSSQVFLLPLHVVTLPLRL